MLSYDKPEPPEPENGLCPKCGTPLEADGDKYDWAVWCPAEDCDYQTGWSHPDV